MSSIPSPHVKIWVQSHMHESPALMRWRQMDPKCFLASQPSWIRFSEKLVWKYKMNRGRWRHPVSITGLHKFMHIHKNMYTDTHTNKCKIDKNKMTAVPVYTIIQGTSAIPTVTTDWNVFPARSAYSWVWYNHDYPTPPRLQGRKPSNAVSPNSPDSRMQFWLKPYSNSAGRGTCSSKTATE